MARPDTNFMLSAKALLTVLIGLAVWGCASTQLVDTWRDPTHSGPRLSKILVIDVTKQAGIRRTFEDELVRQLRAKGLQAVPSYTVIPEDGEAPWERLSQAVLESGVEGVVVTRLVRVDRQTQLYPGTYVGSPYVGLRRFYASAWVGFYTPPQVYNYDIVTAETNLFDVRGDTLIWSGTTETYPQRNVKNDVTEFATVILDALLASKLI
jgi:hypothetical protein